MYACYNHYYNYYTEIILYMCVCVTTYTPSPIKLYPLTMKYKMLFVIINYIADVQTHVSGTVFKKASKKLDVWEAWIHIK